MPEQQTQYININFYGMVADGLRISLLELVQESLPLARTG